MIANPGCYATAAILSLAPIMKEYKIEKNSIVIDGKSGISGAGRVPETEKLLYEAIGISPGFTPLAYKLKVSDWFNSKFNLDALFEEFWGIKTQSKLLAVVKNLSEESHSGLVFEWDTGMEAQGQFRLNKLLAEKVLTSSLGQHSNNEPFSPKTMTVLEKDFFENFLISIENSWKDHWQMVANTPQGKYTYLLYVVEIEGSEDKLSKPPIFCISIPPGIEPIDYNPQIDVLHPDVVRERASELDFYVPINLTLGKTSLKVIDVKGIEKDDLIVLENSSVKHVYWENDMHESIKFNLEEIDRNNPELSNILHDNFDEELGLEEEGEKNNMIADLLTNLPIELKAQFKTISIPLKDIVALEAGQTLPLGLLLNSPVFLMAPGEKPVAQGELVIVGNQFGIKVVKSHILPENSVSKMQNERNAKMNSYQTENASDESNFNEDAANSSQEEDENLEDMY